MALAFHIRKRVFLMSQSLVSTPCSSQDFVCSKSCVLPQFIRDYSSLRETAASQIVIQKTESKLFFEPELKIDTASVLNQVLSELNKKGHRIRFTKDVSEKSPISCLIEHEFGIEEIIDLFSERASLLGVGRDRWMSVLNTLKGVGFLNDQIILIVKELSGVIFDVDLDAIFEGMRQSGLSNKAMVNAVVTSPELLFPENLDKPRRLMHELKSFFSNEQMLFIVNKHPQILMYAPETLLEKYEYIYFKMNLRQDKIVKTEWFKHSVQYVEMRHEFVTRTGAFIRPDDKRPTLSTDNPTLTSIIDSDEKHFASIVAGVTFEEWLVFKRMYKRQLKNLDDSENDLDD